MDDTSLCKAIWDEDTEKVRFLVKSGEDLNAQGGNGHTPLMMAAEIENIEIAKCLLKHGAKINCPGHEGATPLHIAVDISIDGTIQSGGAVGDEPIDMIQILLQNGANKDLKNTKGKSALDWAKDYKSQKVIKVLQNGNS